MDLLLAICQALGLGLAFGIGGPLTALFAAVMARFGAGIDPEGTEWAFFGEDWFITVLFGANVLAFGATRFKLDQRIPLAILAATAGAIAGAASLAEQGETAAIGLVIGALAGGGSALLAGEILAGARKRAASGAGGEGADPGEALTLIFAGAGIVTALLALFVPPASLLVLGALLVVASGRRRKAGEKYEGLRVLR